MYCNFSIALVKSFLSRAVEGMDRKEANLFIEILNLREEKNRVCRFRKI